MFSENDFANEPQGKSLDQKAEIEDRVEVRSGERIVIGVNNGSLK